MDDQEKLKIRRKAKIAIVVADLLLILAFLATFWMYFWQSSGPEAYSGMALGDAKYALFWALTDFEREQSRDVAMFIPPDVADELPAWGQAVHDYLDRPVAAFVRDHDQTTWAFRSPELSFSDSAFKSKMATIDTSHARAPVIDSVGTFTIRLFAMGSKVDSLTRIGYLFGRVGNNRMWGILTRQSDNWLSYCARLKQYEVSTQNGLIDPVGARSSTFLNSKLLLRGKKNWSMRPTARVSINGREIYQTPALDTTVVSLIDTIEGARVELYASSMDKVYRELISSGRFPWGRLVIIVITLSVLHLCWLWIKKLTALAN